MGRRGPAGELVALLVSLERSCVELCASGKGSYNSSLRLHPTAFFDIGRDDHAYEQHHHALAEKLGSLDDDTWNRPAWLTRGEQGSFSETRSRPVVDRAV